MWIGFVWLLACGGQAEAPPPPAPAPEPVLQRGEVRPAGERKMHTPEGTAVAFVYLRGAEGAELKVDGVVVGTLPATVPMAPGPHRFEVIREGQDPLVIEREVVRLERALTRIDLGAQPALLP